MKVSIADVRDLIERKNREARLMRSGWVLLEQADISGLIIAAKHNNQSGQFNLCYGASKREAYDAISRFDYKTFQTHNLRLRESYTFNFKVGRLDYGEITIPAMTRVTHNTATGWDPAYTFVDEFGWVLKKYPNVARSLIHDLKHYSPNIPPEYIANDLENIKFEESHAQETNAERTETLDKNARRSGCKLTPINGQTCKTCGNRNTEDFKDADDCDLLEVDGETYCKYHHPYFCAWCGNDGPKTFNNECTTCGR